MQLRLGKFEIFVPVKVKMSILSVPVCINVLIFFKFACNSIQLSFSVGVQLCTYTCRARYTCTSNFFKIHEEKKR